MLINYYFTLYQDTINLCISYSIIDQKQLENVESFKYLCSILTNDGRCTCEIKRRIAVAKAAFNKKRNLLLAHWTWN